MMNNSIKSKGKVDGLLDGLSSDYFKLLNLNYLVKQKILSKIKRNILINRSKLEDSIVSCGMFT
jgi:hypothetical protein